MGTKILDSIDGIEENIQNNLLINKTQQNQNQNSTVTSPKTKPDPTDLANKYLESSTKNSEQMLKDLNHIRETLLDERKRIYRERFQAKFYYDDNLLEDNFNW